VVTLSSGTSGVERATLVEVRPGLRRIHVTARDVVSRKDVLAVAPRTRSAAAGQILGRRLGVLAFRCGRSSSTAVQRLRRPWRPPVPGCGSNSSCARPGSPRLDGHVERAHRTHQEEFYDRSEIPERLGTASRCCCDGKRPMIMSGRTRRWAI